MLPAVRRPVIVLALAAALLALAAALAGCGGGPTDEEQVASTVSSFGHATAAKDYATLCDKLLSPALIDKVEQVGLPCQQAMRKALGGVQDPRLTIGKITVTGDRATAEIRTSATGEAPSRDTLQLQKVNGSWRIASLGSG
jgi:hypothetical protein